MVPKSQWCVTFLPDFSLSQFYYLPFSFPWLLEYGTIPVTLRKPRRG